jgi:hypothetical protein
MAGALRVETFCGVELVVDFAAWIAGRADVTYDTRAATCAACAARGDRQLERRDAAPKATA